MKKVIQINQFSIIESKINVDIIDVILLDVLIEFSKSEDTVKINSGGNDFIWFSYQKINSEIPLLKMKNDSIYRRMKRLCEIGLLIHFEGSQNFGKSFFAITPKGYGLKSEPTEKTPKSIPKKPIEKPAIEEAVFEEAIFPEERVITKKKTPSKPKPVQDPIYKKCTEIYFEWFEKLSGVKPKFDAIDGASLKKIISYFKSIHHDANDGTDEFQEVTKMFYFIFQKWDLIDPFYQKQTKLNQINSNLQNIINDIKNKHTVKRNASSKDKSVGARVARVQDSFSRIDEMLSKK